MGLQLSIPSDSDIWKETASLGQIPLVILACNFIQFATMGLSTIIISENHLPFWWELYCNLLRKSLNVDGYVALLKRSEQ